MSTAPNQPSPRPRNGGYLPLLMVGGAAAGVVMALLTFGGADLATPGGTGSSLPTPIPDAIREGEPAPDFTAQTPGGEPVTLSDFRGSVVALNFWATWCAPCQVEMPSLQRASEESGGLVVLAVNVGEGQERVQAFLDEHSLTFRVALDRDKTIAALYGVRVFPTTVWIDAEGIVRAEHLGPLSEEQIEDYVRQLAGQ
jgi:cytochrome c biogenesis protein CcmG/thiol:disulfide interchange protein DsbE